jgi:hypothetical protein
LALSEAGEVLWQQRTEAAVLDIGVYGGYLFAAETNRGMSVWKIGESGLSLVSEVSSEGASVRQLVISENGRFAFLHVACHSVWVVNIADPSHPVTEIRDLLRGGLMYERQISAAAVRGRYYAACPHDSYVHWYDTAGEHAERLVCHTNRISFHCGIAPYGDRALVNTAKGYALMDVEYDGLVRDLTLYGDDLGCTDGKPCVIGDRLYITDKMRSVMMELDISDITAPRLLQTYRFAAYIGNVSERDGVLYLAAGREGIAIKK